MIFTTARTACRHVAAALGVLLLAAVASLGAAGDDASLADAVRAQDREAVAELLGRGVDVNAPQVDGTTALHWAAHLNDLQTADQLIRAGAQVSASNL